MKQTFKLHKYLSEHIIEGSPKVSIYMPTHRSMPDAKQDPILFKNYVQQAERELEQNYNRRQWQPLIESLEQLNEDPDFWIHSTDALAILADETGVETFRLEQSIPGKVVTGKHFDLIPLLRYYDTIYSGYLVDIGRDRVNLYRVNQNGAEQVEEEDLIKSFPELYDDLDAEPRMHAGGTRADLSVMHGNKAKPELVEKDRIKYFRYIDEQLRKYITKDTPVIIAGTTENVAEYKSLAKGDFYTEQSIDQPFESIEQQQQPERLREILRPRYRERIKKQLEEFGYLTSQDKTVTGVEKVSEQAEQHRISTLFINSDYEPDDRGQLNNIIDRVIGSGGDVIILSDDKVDDNIAATLRY